MAEDRVSWCSMWLALLLAAFAAVMTALGC